MARIRNIVKWGNSYVIMLKSSDIKDLDINLGKDEVDIEEIIVIKNSHKKNDI